MTAPSRPTALEFFAGGGLARLGLAADFDVIWANDIDPMKSAAYRANFGDDGFAQGDIGHLDAATIPKADLAWASFPCQDLSLAGDRSGIKAHRSGTFFIFVDIIRKLQSLYKAPRILVIENVSGLLTSHDGQDFVTVLKALDELGFQAGALEIDARLFVPQSRPRVFIVAIAKDAKLPNIVVSGGSAFATPAIARANRQLKDLTILSWSLLAPPGHTLTVADIIDANDDTFWPEAKVDALLASLSPRHRALLVEAQSANIPYVGTVYRRTRTKDGHKASFAEIRFDGIAGCLRTPSGGSSRQFLIFVNGSEIKVRALNAREAMRLMGAPDSYHLPDRQRAGLKIAGDGVAVPVVAWLSAHLLAPLAAIPQ